MLSSAYLCCLIQWHLIEVFAFLVWEVLLTHFFEQWTLGCIEIWSEWRNNLVEMIKEFAQIKAWLQTYLSWTHESLADCRCGHALVACHGGGHGAMRSFSLLMTHFQHKASSRPGARSQEPGQPAVVTLESRALDNDEVHGWQETMIPTRHASKVFGSVMFHIVVLCINIWRRLCSKTSWAIRASF